jgi:hypothetical protein
MSNSAHPLVSEGPERRTFKPVLVALDARFLEHERRMI